MKLCAFVTGHRVIPPTRYNWRGTGKLLVAARSERCNTDEISWTKVGGHHRLTDTTSLTLTPSHPHTLTPSHRHRQVLRYAGCAFEAYADLDQEDVHLPRLTPNATSISYLDAEYLESAFEGVVKVEVLSAKLVGGSKTWWNPLSGIDAFKGDPFVKVTMDGTRVQTSTRSRSRALTLTLPFALDSRPRSLVFLQVGRAGPRPCGETRTPNSTTGFTFTSGNGRRVGWCSISWMTT